MGLLGYLENLVNNAELKIQQYEQQIQILQQRIAELEENTVKDVVELEDK
jgi:TolA-binding protein|tara:strand:+ start:397 stop:546 length:150 start_codon:yes stop_codon:yes gene_type:complete